MKTITITNTDVLNVPFSNQVDECIGTGRMGLALQKAYYEQLKLVQEHIGFKHIRGHGLFCDDMAIYQEYEENGVKYVEYNFTYLDMVMDSYRELGLKPFIELGFMPEKMASGTQTIFYWKGNTTPPKKYDDWKELIKALLNHLIDRYGREEVVTWPIEVWNEPNLPGFWYKADMEEYFVLFKESFEAVKEVDPRFGVGGPAICGVNDEVWMRKFMEFCRKEKIALDFVTRHHYTTEFPERVGHYDYQEITDPQVGFDNLHVSREIVDEFEEYKGLPIHLTEFNTSYTPKNPLHDTNQNAAYLAHQLSRLGEDNESYSYWTFGDIFEEQGVPFTPFHGGFGLVANGGIPKPTFWTFAFFKKLKEKKGKCVYKDDNTLVMKLEDGSYRIVAWNHTTKRQGKDVELCYQLEAKAGEYCLVQKLVDEECTNPLKTWHDLGEPANPKKAELEIILAASSPQLRTSHLVSEGSLNVSVTLKENALLYMELVPVKTTPDRGYSYERVMQYE